MATWLPHEAAHSSQKVDASIIEKVILEASGNLIGDDGHGECVLPSSIPPDGAYEEE